MFTPVPAGYYLVALSAAESCCYDLYGRVVRRLRATHTARQSSSSSELPQKPLIFIDIMNQPPIMWSWCRTVSASTTGTDCVTCEIDSFIVACHKTTFRYIQWPVARIPV